MPIVAEAADIDELGHVSNLVYVRWVLDVAMGHSRSLGWDHAQYFADDRHTALVVAAEDCLAVGAQDVTVEDRHDALAWYHGIHVRG